MAVFDHLVDGLLGTLRNLLDKPNWVYCVTLNKHLSLHCTEAFRSRQDANRIFWSVSQAICLNGIFTFLIAVISYLILCIFAYETSNASSLGQKNPNSLIQNILGVFGKFFTVCLMYRVVVR